tara:strand:+ start:472 stop:1083 length:612 start_codon:yes stop_codon:yes gene_type:complete
MDIKSLLVLSFICAMGAISPGPSLAVVIRNTITGGRLQGVMTGIGHGIGLGIYAFIAVLGLSSLILRNELIFNTMQWMGVFLLLWLSYNMFTNEPPVLTKEHKVSSRRGFIEGFMISFLNPKILVFLVAIFSQFITNDLSFYDRAVIAILAGIIDTTWYVFVALMLAGTPLIERIRVNAVIIDRTIGMVLFVFALVLIIKVIG